MSNITVVPAGIIEHESEVVHLAILPCIGVLRRQVPGGIAYLTPGFVAGFDGIAPGKEVLI